MTEAELKRLDELDKIISWNNDTDGGRPLTAEEQAEHTRLAIKLLREGHERTAGAETVTENQRDQITAIIKRLRKAAPHVEGMERLLYGKTDTADSIRADAETLQEIVNNISGRS